MKDDTLDPLSQVDPSALDTSNPFIAVGETQYYAHPEVIPNVDELVIEDGKPVENIFAEKQYRLLTESLYASWKPEGHTFMALSNVALYYVAKHPPLVPDVMLSLDVPVGIGLEKRENLSYFTWIVGKSPDVVIEFVSDRRGSEEDYKMDEYARIGVCYYIIFDPRERLRNGILRVFALRDGAYSLTDPSWLPHVGLGLKLWEGVFEGEAASWLRWCDREGGLIATGAERAEQEKQRAEQEKQRAEQADQRAEQEKQRAERLAAQLRALGIEPNP